MVSSAHLFTLVQLNYFVCVAETQSMAHAAQQLYVSQSTVSAAIMKLESQLGVRLFVRGRKRGLVLTKEGSVLLEHSKKLLTAADELVEATRGVQTGLLGELAIGCFTSLAPNYLPRIIAKSAEQLPGISLKVIEGDLQQLEHALLSEECEVAFMYNLDLDDRLTLVPLVTAEPYAIVAKSHALSDRGDIWLEELSEDPLILLDVPYSRDYFEEIIASVGFRPRIGYRTPNYETLRSLVAAGLGYAIVTQYPRTAGTYDGAGLVPLKLKNDVRPVSVVLAHLTERRLSRKAEEFIRFVRGAALV